MGAVKMESMVLMSREPVKYSREDNGFSLTYTLADPRAGDEAFTLVLQSNEDQLSRKAPKHTLARKLAGKRLKITIEEVKE